MLGITKARLAGGEPTLRDDFIDIVHYCLSLGLKTIIYSNLIDLSKILDDLLPLPVSFVTSIHGDPVFHDSITQIGAYQATYKNIHELIANGKEVNLHTVLMKDNYKYIEYIINTAIEAGIRKISFQTLIPRGKGKDLFDKGESQQAIEQLLPSLNILKDKYQNVIKINIINLYTHYYYILETDGCIYLEKENESKDIFIRRIIP
jgi:MoaA/NifB/PqqE/SkfB family radical SAM enzyme